MTVDLRRKMTLRQIGDRLAEINRGLQLAFLDGRYVNVTGDTMTGDLTIGALTITQANGNLLTTGTLGAGATTLTLPAATQIGLEIDGTTTDNTVDGSWGAFIDIDSNNQTGNAPAVGLGVNLELVSTANPKTGGEALNFAGPQESSTKKKTGSNTEDRQIISPSYKKLKKCNNQCIDCFSVFCHK